MANNFKKIMNKMKGNEFDALDTKLKTCSSDLSKLNDNFIENNKLLINEIDSLKKQNDNIKKQNDNLKNDIKQINKILDSYNENFKLLFYFYELKPKGVLKNIQDICQEVLNFVSNVCMKYGIEYWIEGGTHLGAVRHKGFLPWDDDIDLGMMRKDYEKFIEVFKLEIKHHNLEKNLKMRLLRHGDNVLYFIQISYSRFAVLDIFPYDYIENPPENIKELYDKEKSVFKSNILEGMEYADAVSELHSHLNLSYDPQPYVIPGVERPKASPFHVQDSNELFPLKNIEFNGREYSSHKNDDYHLQKLYGDWENLPKILERHNRVYKVKKRPNIENILEINLDLLKKVNETYDY